jgi:uncharacterized protein YydD (DUF2326 family)
MSSYLKKEYTKMMADKITISIEDLSNTEVVLIDAGFAILEEKLEDIKLLNDEIRRFSIELANLKIYTEDLDKDRRGSPDQE